MTNMETDLPYLERDHDRHGNPRIYVRRNGKRVRIRETGGHAEFAKAVCGCASRSWTGRGRPSASQPLTTHAKGTLGWLGAKYFVSKGEENFSRSTRNRSALAATCLEDLLQGATERRRRRADGELSAKIPLGAEDQAHDRGGR